MRTSFAVFPLSVAMILATLQAVLMATVGLAALFQQGCHPTQPTAIALSPITMATDPEKRIACKTNPLSKIDLVGIRHPGRPVGLDKDDGSWQGRTIGYSMASSQGLPSWGLAVTAARPRVVFPTFHQATYTLAAKVDP
jgi:hypothetical protein